MNKEIQNQITRSKNRGLFLTILEETNKYSFGVAVKKTYNKSLIVSSFVFDKSWKEVYLK